VVSGDKEREEGGAGRRREEDQELKYRKLWSSFGTDLAWPTENNWQGCSAAEDNWQAKLSRLLQHRRRSNLGVQ
jgi:hypothetical protein